MYQPLKKMLLNILKQFNWIDLFVIVILIRIGYVALKTSLFVEFFKILGTLAALYLALHYFTGLSDYLRAHLPIKNIPLQFLDFLSCLILVTVGYLVFGILREAIARLIKIEPIPQLDRWGGLIFGMGRAFLLSSLIIFMLTISSVTYLKRSVVVSYSGESLFKIAPAVYANLWNGFFSKFMRAEKFNQTIEEVQAGFLKK